MAIALVQSNEGISTTAVTTASFSVTPTNGNLIVLAFAADDYNGTPDAGWTQSAEMEQQTFHGGYVWWRIAAGGSNSFQYTINSASPSVWNLLEFSGVHATPYDTSQGKFDTSPGGGLISDAITPTTGNRVLVAMRGISSSSNLSAVTCSWDSSFTLVRDIGNSLPATKQFVSTAYRLVTGNGSTSFTTTGTTSVGADSRTSLVIAFKEAASTGYTVTAAAGAYALTGTTTATRKAWKPAAAAGAYALTGTPATFGTVKKILADVGAYSLTGTAAVTRYGKRSTAAVGSYALTGTPAILTKVSGTGAVPVYRSVANTTYGSRTAETVCDAPAGLIDGDILIAAVFAGKGGDPGDIGAEIDITPPAGWTQIGTDTEVFSGGFNGTLQVYWKRAAGEGATYSFAHTGTQTTTSTQVAIAAYSGCVTTGNPVDVFSQNASAVDGSTATAIDVTTTGGNRKLLYAAHNWDGSGTLTPPTGMTERFDGLVYLSDESRASVGATGNRTQTLASSHPWAAFLVALKPALGGVATYAVTAAPGAYSLTGTPATATKAGGGGGSGGGSTGLPVYRAQSSTTYASNTGTTVCPVPSGVGTGDILIAGVFAGKTGDATALADIAITPPPGWTQIGVRAEGYDGAGFAGTFYVYWKRATSSEGTSYSFAHTAAPGIYTTQVVISAYSNSVASGSPINVFSQADADTGTLAAAPAITTTSPNTKLVYVGHNWDGTATLSPPTGMTERFDSLAYLSDEDRVSTGATGDRSQTLVSSHPWAAFLLALLPGAPVSTYLVTAASGAYTLTGTAATLTRFSLNKYITALPGAYTLTGTTVTTGRGLISLGGSYTMTGRPAGLRKNGYGLLGLGGSYTLTGYPAGLMASSVPPSALSGMKVWTGSTWVEKPAKVWTGSAWVTKPVKVWNGSAWT